MATLKELRDVRLDKLDKLHEMGINPYPADSTKDYPNNEIVENYDEYEGQEVTLTGRIMTWREHGSIMFANLEDFSGKIQVFIKDEKLENTDVKRQILGFEDLKLLDLGDFIEVKGKIVKTKTGEISIEAKAIKLLSKSLRPLPDKHEGLKDKETRLRRRYLDFATNPEVREIFVRKAKFWDATRKFLCEKGFVEVAVPVLEHHVGGGDAKPFTTYMDSIDQTFYLRISQELFLKRLIGGGFEKVFDIGPRFRNEGISDEHLPEHYAIEWYWAYADYKDNMKLNRDLFRYVAKEVYGRTKFQRGDLEFDLADEWEELDYTKLIKDTFDIDILKDSEEKMVKVLEQNKVFLESGSTRFRIIDNLWKLIRKDIAGPAFVVNEPKFMSPLAKSLPDNPEITERYHAILGGSELSNGYSELNDPIDQFERFKEQQDARDAGDEEAQMMDIDFVEMLEYGMPPTSGHGHSERVFWFLEDLTAKEGTAFPQMKFYMDETTKDIYDIKSHSQPEQAKKDSPGPDLSESNKKDDNVFDLPSRKEAEKLLEEHVDDDYQKLHAKMVASGLEMYAKELDEDEDLWYITGLLHDIDYFEHPEEHPAKSIEWFRDWGFPDELSHAVNAHYWKATGVEPQTKLAAALIAVDELSGLLYAYSLMRPTGWEGMKAKSAKKKFKDKTFAAKVDRSDITYGVEKFGVELGEHMQKLIDIFSKMDELNS